MGARVTTVVAIDPGGTTGLALWHPNLGLSLRELSPAEEAVDWLAVVLRGGHKHVIIERYIITPATAKMSQQHDALEIIGAVKYLSRKHGHTLTLQSPSEAKAFSTDAKLKTAGWYKPGLPHARDASRHALLYLAKHGIIELHALLGEPSASL